VIGFAVGVFLGLCLAAGVLLWRELKANEAFMETLAGPVVGKGWPPMPKPLPPPPPRADFNCPFCQRGDACPLSNCADSAKGAAHCREEKAV
jgi:hypothetical protein